MLYKGFGLYFLGKNKPLGVLEKEVRRKMCFKIPKEECMVVVK